jgi:hypothetical protein
MFINFTEIQRKQKQTRDMVNLNEIKKDLIKTMVTKMIVSAVICFFPSKSTMEHYII